MINNRRICPTCKRAVNDREISLFTGMVSALWRVFEWAKQTGVDEFSRKDIKHLFKNENETARFGDWPIFSDILTRVEEGKKGHYKLNKSLASKFFADELEVPMTAWKDMVTKEVRLENYGTISQIPHLNKFLDENGDYVTRYKDYAGKKDIKTSPILDYVKTKMAG